MRLDRFPNVVSARLWLVLFACLVPISYYLRTHFLSNILLEPHPWRQTQTALTIVAFFRGETNFFYYESPFQGRLWNFVFEFPIYQWIVAKVMILGLSLEAASRIVTLFFFNVSAGVFFLILKENINFHVAAWGLLLYLVSPFSIVFSRTCLIDFTAQAFMLGTWYFFLRALKKPATATQLFAVALLGSLTGLIKVTLWFGPGGLMGLIVLWRFATKKLTNRETRNLLIALFIQVAFVLIWMKWTNSRRSQSGILNTEDWYFGPLAIRFEWFRWKKIITWCARSVLHDWMVIPFLAGLVFSGKYRTYVLVSAALIFFPIAIMFNVHTWHDYYLISQFPYLILIAAIGIHQISCGTKRLLIPVSAVIAMIFAHSLIKSPISFAPLFRDYSEVLTVEKSIQKVTHETDLIFSSQRTDPFQLPLYSNRSVATLLGEEYLRANDSKNPLDPNVFYFPTEVMKLRLLSPYDRVWVQRADAFTFYRVKENGPYAYDPAKYISVSDSLPTNKKKTQLLSSVLQLNLCRDPNSFTGIENASTSHKTIEIRNAQGVEILVPARKYLTLPTKSDLGCQFEISLSDRGWQ